MINNKIYWSTNSEILCIDTDSKRVDRVFLHNYPGAHTSIHDVFEYNENLYFIYAKGNPMPAGSWIGEDRLFNVNITNGKVKRIDRIFSDINTPVERDPNEDMYSWIMRSRPFTKHFDKLLNVTREGIICSFADCILPDYSSYDKNIMYKKVDESLAGYRNIYIFDHNGQSYKQICTKLKGEKLIWYFGNVYSYDIIYNYSPSSYKYFNEEYDKSYWPERNTTIQYFFKNGILLKSIIKNKGKETGIFFNQYFVHFNETTREIYIINLERDSIHKITI